MCLVTHRERERRRKKKHTQNLSKFYIVCLWIQLCIFKTSKMPSLSTEDSLDHQLNDENRNDTTLSGPIIGIIYPPPEVRSKFNLKEYVSHTCIFYISFYFNAISISLRKIKPDIVDKTASFVARNGPEFEARIRQNELGNPKFNFLNSGDPYHSYYQHKVNEFREGKRKCEIFHLLLLAMF